MIYLMSAPVIVLPGRYDCTRTDFASFKSLVREARKKKQLTNRVGYASTAQVLMENLGFNVEVHKAPIPLQDGDSFAVARVLQTDGDRPRNPTLADLEFLIITYHGLRTGDGA